jgi:hypothetical protein
LMTDQHGRVITGLQSVRAPGAGPCLDPLDQNAVSGRHSYQGRARGNQFELGGHVAAMPGPSQRWPDEQRQ